MISQKQQKILAFPYSKYDALICDGAAALWHLRQDCGQRK